jgi:hypothetical protein
MTRASIEITSPRRVAYCPIDIALRAFPIIRPDGVYKTINHLPRMSAHCAMVADAIVSRNPYLSARGAMSVAAIVLAGVDVNLSACGEIKVEASVVGVVSGLFGHSSLSVDASACHSPAIQWSGESVLRIETTINKRYIPYGCGPSMVERSGACSASTYQSALRHRVSSRVLCQQSTRICDRISHSASRRSKSSDDSSTATIMVMRDG